MGPYVEKREKSRKSKFVDPYVEKREKRPQVKFASDSELKSEDPLGCYTQSLALKGPQLQGADRLFGGDFFQRAPVATQPVHGSGRRSPQLKIHHRLPTTKHDA